MLATHDLVALVGVADLARAREFYGGVLGLPVVEESSFAVAVDAHGTRLRLTAVEHPVAAPYSVLGWAVDDVDAVLDGLAARGVVALRYDGLEQDARGVWTAPDGTRVAWFHDPDRNTLSLVQSAGG